jgi:hypothetical protein
MGRAAQSPLIRSFRGWREPLSLPRRIGVTAWRWLGLGTLASILWAVWSLMGRGRARVPRRWSWCWAGDHPGAACGPAVSAPVCVPRRGLPRPALAAYLANGLLEEALPLGPAAIGMLGPAGRWASPLVPIAMLSARLVSIQLVEHVSSLGSSGRHRMLSTRARPARTGPLRAPAPTAPAPTAPAPTGRDGQAVGGGSSQKGLV